MEEFFEQVRTLLDVSITISIMSTELPNPLMFMLSLMVSRHLHFRPFFSQFPASSLNVSALLCVFYEQVGSGLFQAFLFSEMFVVVLCVRRFSLVPLA